jgi:hypothetical protein
MNLTTRRSCLLLTKERPPSPVVTSLVQIVHSGRSLTEAANIASSTNLPLLSVLLSFVTGLFRINNRILGYGLGMYFSVPVPLCAVWFCCKIAVYEVE